MLITLTEPEMLSKWKLITRHEPLAGGACVITRTDGYDADALLLDRVRAWYAGVLDSAPANLLPVTDFAADVMPLPGDEGGVVVRLPRACRRVVEVKLTGWLRCARIVDASSADPAVARQLSPYTRAGVNAPVALASPGRLTLYPAPEAGTVRPVERLLAVAAPADGTYVFDSSLLSTIPGFCHED